MVKIIRYKYVMEEGLGVLIDGYIAPFKEMGLPNYIEYPLVNEPPDLRKLDEIHVEEYIKYRIEEVDGRPYRLGIGSPTYDMHPPMQVAMHTPL